ncbi:MAG: HIT domain-containing protein [Holophagales bacterium]|jgi:diadenosine tetraphosphate (Ap4A) HIT family hydrolase|nr:HIT domain-containing protein [Holophagales bacterium]MBK9966390.1 HIT domain-containing protein [Holophagales bacterium]
MSAHPECFYCEEDQRQADLMVRVGDLSVSSLFVFREQTYAGRCLVAYRHHVNELFELADAERDAFCKDVADAARAIKAAFGPVKVNCGAYSDKLGHLHVHLVPKYVDGPDYGSTFRMMPEPRVLLSDAGYASLAARIRAAL